jgi:putative endonuclease
VPPRAAVGARAEDLAVALLVQQGFRILTRNWRHPEGELDVIADDAGVCVFVEVRSRTGQEHGHALETVSAHKRAQVIRAARLYLHQEPPHASAYRFDVVGVTFFEDGRPPETVHVQDAFRVDPP